LLVETLWFVFAMVLVTIEVPPVPTVLKTTALESTALWVVVVLVPLSPVVALSRVDVQAAGVVPRNFESETPGPPSTGTGLPEEVAVRPFRCCRRVPVG